MNLETVVPLLEIHQSDFPEEAVAWAAVHPEAITPPLLAMLDRVSADPEPHIRQRPLYMGHLFALYLLAQFREASALPAVKRFSLLPEDDLDWLVGDLVTEDLARIIASVSGNRLQLAKELAEAPDAYAFVRSAAFQAIPIQVIHTGLARERAAAFLASVADQGLHKADWCVWGGWLEACTNLQLADLVPRIRDLFDRVPDLNEFDDCQRLEEEIAGSWESARAELQQNHYCTLIDDAAAEIRPWYRQVEDDTDDDDRDLEDALLNDEEPDLPTPPSPEQVQLVADEYRTGRNDPCPCGSGRKYKKCCARR